MATTEPVLTRTLDTDQRRRMAARMLAAVAPDGRAIAGGHPCAPSRSSRSGGPAGRRRHRDPKLRRRIVPLLLELPARLGFPAAFCAAAAAWGTASALVLLGFGLLDR